MVNPDLGLLYFLLTKLIVSQVLSLEFPSIKITSSFLVNFGKRLIADSIFPSSFLHGIIMLAELYSVLIVFSSDLATTYCLKQKKDNRGKVAKYLFTTLPIPKNLIGVNEYNELFFEKIDEIDNSIANGMNFKEIQSKFNLEKFSSLKFNEEGINKSSTKIENFPNSLIKSLFKEDVDGKVLFFENEQKFFIVDLEKFENIQKTLSNLKIKNEISRNIEFNEKNKFILDLIKKINENNFTKENFDNLANIGNTDIQEIELKNINDKDKLNLELVGQIYKYPKNKIGLVANQGLNDAFLVYIKNIENTSLAETSDIYGKYLNLSKIKLTTNLYNTYDEYIKKNYKIDINDEALDSVKNYFIF